MRRGGSHCLDPTLLAAGDHIFRLAFLRGGLAHLLDERRGLGCGAHVVPQHGVADHVALLVEDHHAVLLSADCDRLDVVKTARLLCRFLEGVPPILRVDGRAVGMLGLAESHHFAGLRVGDAHLAGLGRGVDAGHKLLSHLCLLAMKPYVRNRSNRTNRAVTRVPASFN